MCSASLLLFDKFLSSANDDVLIKTGEADGELIDVCI
jgi:hypothetical protein